MKKKKIPKAPKKFIYIQDWGTYNNQTLVCVGMSHKEICAAMPRLKVDKKVAFAFAQQKNLAEKWLTKDNFGAGWFFEGRTVLWFREWKNDWGHWDTLLHECSHLVDGILRNDKHMEVETEGCAYQLEFLFREIRRKLWSVYGT